MGGYIASFALRAAGASSPHAHPAAFSCHYLGVARFEPIDIRSESRKEGRGATSQRVEISQDGRAVLDAMVWSAPVGEGLRSEAHTSELQSLMRTSSAVFCLHKKKL